MGSCRSPAGGRLCIALGVLVLAALFFDIARILLFIQSGFFTASLKHSVRDSPAGMPENSAIPSSADGNGTRGFERASAHKPVLRKRFANVFRFSKTTHLIRSGVFLTGLYRVRMTFKVLTRSLTKLLPPLKRFIQNRSWNNSKSQNPYPFI